MLNIHNNSIPLSSVSKYKRKMKKKISPKSYEEILAGMAGLEPARCKSQSLVPYHLATSQSTYTSYHIYVILSITKVKNQKPSYDGFVYIKKVIELFE